MQPTRTLADIVSSLQSVYQPQIDIYKQQQAALPQQAQAQSDALNAKKDQAFGDILAGARRRGLGFAGIPLGDQAKYLATDYAPALANLQTASTNQATSLEQAILQLRQQQNEQANSIYQSEQDRALAAKQAAAQSNAFSGLFNQPQQQPQQVQSATTDPYANINKQNANNAIHSLLNTGNVGLIRQTIDAITKSANAGNPYDKYKLELLQAVAAGNKNAAYDPTYAKLLRDAANYKPTPSSKTQNVAKGAAIGTFAPLLFPGLGPLGGALTGGLAGYFR